MAPDPAEGGLLQQLTKRVLEATLDVEITDHLGYDKGDPAGNNGQNSRNGVRGKTVLIEVHRDRHGTVKPQIVRKAQRRSSEVEDTVISLSAKALMTGLERHLIDEAWDHGCAAAHESECSDRTCG